jgi:hypothetical protein
MYCIMNILCIENPFNDNNKGICFTHDGKKIIKKLEKIDDLYNEYF